MSWMNVYYFVTGVIVGVLLLGAFAAYIVKHNNLDDDDE